MSKATISLSEGKNRRIIHEAPAAAGTKTEKFTIDAESVQISLFVTSTSGSLNVTVYTWTENPAHRVAVITFPTITATTTDLLIRKSSATMSQLTVEVTYTDAAEYELWARGVSAAEASVRIIGAGEFDVTQTTVSVAGTLLVPAALTDRIGVGIFNDNTAAADKLYIGPTALKSATSAGVPVQAGGNVTMDVAAGVAIYGSPASGAVDVRIAEIGGS